MNELHVDTYELNLSVQEYLYFQECPQKFKIHRFLNPVPYKMSFESSAYSLEQYRLRGYERILLNGIEMHVFFKSFHETYYPSIVIDKLPESIVNNRAKSIYWHKQRDLFYQLENKAYWTPFRRELRIMSENLRGIIDSLVFSSNGEQLSLLDFKRQPHINDKETLLFYFILLQEYIVENDLDFPIVNDISCYYYETGLQRSFDFNDEDIQLLRDKLSKIRQDILEVNLEFSRNVCFNCRYSHICIIEQRRI